MEIDDDLENLSFTEEEKEFNQMRRNLGKKLDKEIYDYKQKLIKQKPEDIIKNAYELVCKQEISDYLSYDRNYTKEQLQALLETNNILGQGYDQWLEFDGGLKEALEWPTDDLVDEITKHYKEKNQTKDNSKKINPKEDIR